MPDEKDLADRLRKQLQMIQPRRPGEPREPAVKVHPVANHDYEVIQLTIDLENAQDAAVEMRELLAEAYTKMRAGASPGARWLVRVRSALEEWQEFEVEEDGN